MFEADIRRLRTLSTTVNTVAAEIDKIDVRTNGNKLVEALPGCAVGPACVQSGEFIEGAWLRISQRLQQLSSIVGVSTTVFQASDEEFKLRLDTMDFKTQGES
ncbi:hypothetical protein [Nocardia sp. NPDC051832]|uniref:hypothetical protein n=1 Tax=Nocardia sp. NPDC051832 TaxID=3155673 RepID=UPI003432E688